MSSRTPAVTHWLSVRTRPSSARSSIAVFSGFLSGPRCYAGTGGQTPFGLHRRTVGPRGTMSDGPSRVEAMLLLLSQDACQCNHQHVWVRRLVNQLTGRTGAIQPTEAAVDNERNVALFQPGAHSRGGETPMQGVVDDRGGEPVILALGHRILKCACDDNPGPSFLEALRNVEGDDRFVLDDKHKAPVQL